MKCLIQLKTSNIRRIHTFMHAAISTARTLNNDDEASS